MKNGHTTFGRIRAALVDSKHTTLTELPHVLRFLQLLDVVFPFRADQRAPVDEKTEFIVPSRVVS